MIEEDVWPDFDEKKTDLEWDCPEHCIPQDKPKVPKQYKVTRLSHKQNEPITKTETKNVST
jgi:hypothetical protein